VIFHEDAYLSDPAIAPLVTRRPALGSNVYLGIRDAIIINARNVVYVHYACKL